MTLIIVPKLIGMDTSTLIGLANDLSSPIADHRDAGENFVGKLFARGWIPVISFENIAEMSRHGDDETVNDRILMFSKFSQIAHVDSLKHPGFPGCVADVLAREVRTFLREKTSDALSIAKVVRDELFAFCDGKKITNGLREAVEILRALVRQGHPREKCISSISHIDIMEIGDRKFGTFRTDTRVDPAMIERHCNDLRSYLKRHLHSRGVKGVDHDAFADEFALSCEAHLLANAGPDGSCTFGDLANRLLQSYGIDPAQVSANTTVDEIAIMAGFNHRLKVASRAIGLAQPVVGRDIPIERCPSQIIQTGLERERMSAPRAEAGDLMDSNLSSLACYCDLTIVDKRTRDYLHRVRMHDNLARELIRNVASLSTYTDLLSEHF